LKIISACLDFNPGQYAADCQTVPTLYDDCLL